MNYNGVFIRLLIINRDLPFIVNTVAVSVAALDGTIYMVILYEEAPITARLLQQSRSK